MSHICKSAVRDKTESCRRSSGLTPLTSTALALPAGLFLGDKMQAAVTRHSAEGCSRADSAGCGQELSCNSQQQQRSDILRVRKAHYGPNTSLNYETPLHIVRGEVSERFHASTCQLASALAGSAPPSTSQLMHR
jgi:hypothetical protein